MKRVLIGLMVLTLALFFTGAAFAQNTIPKTVCFTFPGLGQNMHLLFKSLGSVKTGAGNKKMFQVTGNIHFGAVYSFPVTGTAYLLNTPSATAHMNLTGTAQVGAELATFLYDIFWDTSNTATPVAIINGRILTDVVSGNFADLPLTLLDCVTDPIPFSAEEAKSMMDEFIRQHP